MLASQRIRQSVRRQQAKGFHTFVWKEAWASLVMEFTLIMCLLLRHVSREDGYGDTDELPVVIGGQWGEQ